MNTIAMARSTNIETSKQQTILLPDFWCVNFLWWWLDKIKYTIIIWFHIHTSNSYVKSFIRKQKFQKKMKLLLSSPFIPANTNILLYRQLIWALWMRTKAKTSYNLSKWKWWNCECDIYFRFKSQIITASKFTRVSHSITVNRANY